MKRIIISGILILALLLQSIPTQPVNANYAEEQVTTENQQEPLTSSDQPVINTSDETGKVTFIGASENGSLEIPGIGISSLSANDMSAAALDAYAPLFGIASPTTDLSLQTTDSMDRTGNYYRYQQTYLGIPVMAGEIVVNISPEGKLISMSGEASPDLSLDIDPVITTQQAISAAQELLVARYGADASLVQITQPQLWIYDERLLMPSTKQAELVWRMEASVEDQPVNLLVLVNALTGGISLKFNQIDSDTTGRTWSQTDVHPQDGILETPTDVITPEPEVTDTPVPTEFPTAEFTPTQWITETATPTDIPTEIPTVIPTEIPTEIPTVEDTVTPTNTPEPEDLPIEPEADGGKIIWYVSASAGNDTNDCLTTSTPCATIQAAVTKAAEGDSIFITAETYTGTTNSVVIIQKSLNLVGGWDSVFTTRVGNTRLDGQNTLRGIKVARIDELTTTPPITVNMTNFEVLNGNGQVNSSSESGYGGGLLVGSLVTLTLRNSSIHNCSAKSGGGIFLSGSQEVRLLNTTIANNQATQSGGGIYSDYYAKNLYLGNVTIAQNTAYKYGGVYYSRQTSTYTLFMQNSVMSGNVSTSVSANSGNDCFIGSGSIVSTGYNLIQDAAGCEFTHVTGDITGKNARFGEMLENGELFIPPDSPIVDAGNPLDPGTDGKACLATDQSGSIRPEDGNNDQTSRCDVGASEIQYFEYTEEPSLSLLSNNNQIVDFNSNPTLWLSVKVSDQKNIPMPGKTITYTAPSTGASGTFSTLNSNSISVTTNENGIAQVSFHPNTIPGKYQILASLADTSLFVNIDITNIGKWYVSSNGNDLNDCFSPQTSCKTIQAAADKASPGNTVYITAETYTSSTDNVVNILKNLTLSGGWNSDFSTQVGMTVIDGQAVRRGLSIGDKQANLQTTVKLNNFEIKNCKAPLSSNSDRSYKGGGIYMDYRAYVAIKNSSIHDNKAEEGAGIYLFSYSSLDLRNSTIGLNEASISGGGLQVSPTTSLAIGNSTIAKNKAVSGGGVYILSSSPRIWNSMIGENSATNSPDCYVSSHDNIASYGYNIIQKLDGCRISTKTSDLFGLRLALGPLLSTGAFLIPPFAPSIDSGSPLTPGSDAFACETSDQLGVARPVDGNNDSIARCDIGATEVNYFDYESIPTTLLSVSGEGQTSQINNSYVMPLAVYVEDQNGIYIPNVPVTFTSQGDSAGAIFSDTGTNTTTVLTDSSGIAYSPKFFANNSVGSYTISVTTPGFEGKITINEENLDYWYVSVNGNDANDCNSPSTACKNLQVVIPKIAADDKIRLGTGTYTSTSLWKFEIAKSLTLSGGWDSTFTNQTGLSTLDASPSRSYPTLAITAAAANVVLERLKIIDGSVGIESRASTSFKLDKSVITNNAKGLKVYGPTTITNSSIIDNHGGEIFTGIDVAGGPVVINNSTIYGNAYAPDPYNHAAGIGVSSSASPEVKVMNSIVANNTSRGTILDCEGTITSVGNNVFGSVCASKLLSSDVIDANPRLSKDVSADYYMPLPGSTVVDHGNSTSAGSQQASCLSVDQNGSPRPVDGNADGTATCDIGAVEYQTGGTTPKYLLAYGSKNRNNLPGTLMKDPLGIIVVDKLGKAISGIDVTFSGPVTGASGTFTGSGTNEITVTTDAAGVAIAGDYRANGKVGYYSILATIDGLPPFSFSISNGALVSIYSMQGSKDTSLLPGTLVCNNDSWTSCTFKKDNNADQALEYSQDTLKFFFSYHGRNGLNNAGMPVLSVVRFGVGYQNSFWDGSEAVFGDDEPVDDTVAHELTHGVTDSTSRLLYFYQSGAISESLSDMWGEFVDQTNGSTDDTAELKWKLGEGSASGIYRSMSNPPWYAQPDRMTSEYYRAGYPYSPYDAGYDNGGVHTNSGVNNKAVFLMTEGGVFNGYSITGIGLQKVAAIYYEAQTHLLTSGANYSDLYFDIQQACNNLLGGSEGIILADCGEVRKALDAVQMNYDLPNNYMPKAEICPKNSVPTNLFFDDFESANSNWNFATSTKPAATWGRIVGYAAGGKFSMFGADISTNADASAIMAKGVTIPSTGTTYLYFDHSYGLEFENDRYFDGAVLQYSLDGGSWKDANALLDSGAGYSGKIFDYTGDTNPLRGVDAFVSDSHGYVSSRYNLSTSAIKGHSIRFRWRVASDSAVGHLGWAVDNVRIYKCEKTSPGGLLFSDDFSTAKNWKDNSAGKVLRDATNKVLNWTASQNSPMYYSMPIYASDNPIQLDFRFKVLSGQGDATLWVGLAKELSPLTQKIAGNDLAGEFIGIDTSDKIQFLSTSSNLAYSLVDPASSDVAYLGTYAWRRGILTIEGTTWDFVLKDDSGLTLGEMSGELKSQQGYYNYLVLMSNRTDGTGKISGVIDDLVVYGTAGSITDTVSGTVKNVKGGPVAGVTISDGVGNSVKTDANGNYTLSKLHKGNKVITPSLTGNAFTPAYQLVLAQDKTTGVNFTLNNKLPTLSSLEISHVAAGTASLKLVVMGTDFVENSVVRWNGENRPTTFINSTKLMAVIPGTDLVSPATVAVKVFTPLPGGGESKAQNLIIAPVTSFTDIPQLTTPVANAEIVTTTPKFAVSSVAKATKYQFQIATDMNFYNILIDQTQTTNSYSLPSAKALKLGQTYYWRVRAKTSNDYESPWSNSRSLLITVLSAPSNGAVVTTLKPKFTWLAFSGAKLYKLQISTSAGFTAGTIILDKSKLSTTSYTLTTALPKANIYYWRVGVMPSSGGAYIFVPARKLIVSPTLPGVPGLISPDPGKYLNTDRPVFSWNASSGTGNKYQIQISTNTAFTSLVQNVSLGTDVLKYQANPLSEGTYYWRVRAVNYLGAPGAWAAYRAFSVDITKPAIPVLSSPANAVTVRGTPTYSWLTAAGASKYQFAYGTTSDCNASEYKPTYLSSANLTSLSFAPPTQAINTEADPSYYWCVRALDVAGNISNWSAANTITIIPPITVGPSLLSPASGASMKTPVLDLIWKSVPYGINYQVQVSNTATFDTLIIDRTLDAGVLTTNLTTTGDGVYYWRVQAINALSEPGSWSSTSSFTVDTIAPQAPVTTSPVKGASVTTTIPKFTVSTVSDAKSYEFQFDKVGDFKSPYLNVITTTPSFTPANSQAFPFGVIYWRVRSIDSAGNVSVWSSSTNIFVTILITPTNGSTTTDSTPTYTWGTAANALNYEIQVAVSPANFDKNVLVFDKTTAASVHSLSPSSALKPKVYYWRMRVKFAKGWSDWTTQYKFTVK
ncbi:MAG: M4 family metallopeptidase [Anaerolineaceae bacterium]|nr:M4 family metallopeptidase [Anaerolineaceae bacterium]